MPYSDFTLKKVKEAFQLHVIENENLFSEINAIEVSEYLKETLKYNVPLATAVNTEKARSELIIANVLLELKKIVQNGKRRSLKISKKRVVINSKLKNIKP